MPEDSFGNITPTGPINQAFTYTGREWEGALPSGTGLYYYRARYYDPSVGRFISEDPIGFDGGVNFYPYVGNNPINSVDPFGLAPRPLTPAEKAAIQKLIDRLRKCKNFKSIGDDLQKLLGKDSILADDALPWYITGQTQPDFYRPVISLNPRGDST